MIETKNYRAASREELWSLSEKEGLSIREIEFGAILRIADATEKMATQYNKLINDRNMYEGLYVSGNAEIARLNRSNAALRGVIKRLKKERAK